MFVLGGVHCALAFSGTGDHKQLGVRCHVALGGWVGCDKEAQPGDVQKMATVRSAAGSAMKEGCNSKKKRIFEGIQRG